MTLQEKLNICSSCTNRKLDIATGMLCGLTYEKPTFETNCNDYNKDEHIRETLVAAKYKDLEIVKGEQNFSIGLIFSITVGVIFSILWALVTVATKYQIGIMAIAIGAGVGFTMRYFGKGIEMKFGIAGAIIALLSCFFGNILCIIGLIADQQNVSVIDVFVQVSMIDIIQFLYDTITVTQVFFYALATYEGFRFSFRNLENENY